MKKIEELKIKIFADGADKSSMLKMYEKSYIQGFTTNPTLMKLAGINNYSKFCKDILLNIKDKPVSLEVFSDDFEEMKKQAIKIANWADNVYVKIPVTNTKGESSKKLIEYLLTKNIKINVTAIMTLEQIYEIEKLFDYNHKAYISIFAGRIADTGIDPESIVKQAVKIFKDKKNIEIIWASPRELFNIFQAERTGCHIITISNDILKKMSIIGYDLKKYSQDTVKMFYDDALSAGYKI